MALSLQEIYSLHEERGTLFQRIVAACGVKCFDLLNSQTPPTEKQLAWAMSVRADPHAAAVPLFRGMVTHPALRAASAVDVRAGMVPTDEQITTIVDTFLNRFVFA